MNQETLIYKYGWADVYPKKKYQKYPDKLLELHEKRDQADRDYMSLTDQDPLDWQAMHAALIALDKIEAELGRVEYMFNQVPTKCKICGGGIMASGNKMTCPTCGKVYRVIK